MFNIWNKISDFFKKHPWLSEAAVFFIMLALYLPLQASKGFADPDSFYHLKMAELIAAHGPVRNFIWLPFTTLANNFADHHFLYHVALIPFIKLFGPFPGIKIAAAFFAAGAIAAMAWAIRFMGLRYAAAFALVSGVMSPFLFRINLSKASALGVIFLLVGLALAARKRTWPLALVAFFYVWTHGSWPALVGLGTVVILVVSWPEKGDRPLIILKRGLSPLAALWFGAIAGVVINPFFPQNLKFYWEQIVQIAVINYQDKIGVGSEWYPYLPLKLASDLPLLCLMIIVALAIFPIVVSRAKQLGRQRQMRLAVALSVCALAFLVLTLRSQRHVEYFVPLAVAAVAAWVSEFRFPVLPPAARRALVSLLVVCGLLAMVGVYAGNGLAKARRDLSGGYSFTLYQKAAEYLKAHATPNEIVVNADWDDMPPLFYWDDQNRYIMGLDPTFMYSANSGRYWDYVNFTLGKSADPASVMKELDSRYIVADRTHRDLDKMLERSGKFTLVYSDKESEIYILK